MHDRQGSGKFVISVVTVKFDFRFEFLTATSMLSNFQRRTRTEFYNLRSIGNFGLDFPFLVWSFRIRFCQVVVEYFYYNATPKEAPQKREYGEAT